MFELPPCPRTRFFCLTMLLFGGTFADIHAGDLRQGETCVLGDRKAVIKRVDTLPYVENAYTKRFHFDTAANPKLRELRERYQLDKVIEPGKDEFDRQVLLLDWVNRQFGKFGRPTTDAHGALQILKAVDEGNAFFCTQYGEVLVSAAASMGWVDRPLALRRPDDRGRGATEHTSTEIWSNQFRKWILFDPTFALYVERNGVPLNAYELRQEWFYHDGRELVFVLGKDRRRYRKADLPIVRRHFVGFGDLSVDDTLFDMYAFIGYIPNTDLMDRGPDYGRMFITRDAVCAKTAWHQRMSPAHPAVDPYFPINQASLQLAASAGGLRVSLRTLTPNFQGYRLRIDGGTWRPTTAAFHWPLHQGTNRLEARTVNKFGVKGPISTAVVDVKGE